MGRRPLLAANWKMHKTVAQARLFAESLGQKSAKLPGGIDLVICPPFTTLQSLRVILPSRVKLGAQNVHFETQGAFTGEVSAPMLAELGVDYVVVGHSERRQLFQETDDWVSKKTRAVLQHGMKPIICVGENLSEQEQGLTEQVVRRQTEAAFTGLSREEASHCVIAYEPVWAIGSGRTPSAEDAQGVIAYIRSVVRDTVSQEAAQLVPILYGGSVKPGNIASFTQQPDIDGALVGGASLEPDSFFELAVAMQAEEEM